MVATIDEISHKDVVGIWDVTTDAEQLEEVVELTVDISDNSAGGGHLVDVTLVVNDLLGLGAQLLNLALTDNLTLRQSL